MWGPKNHDFTNKEIHVNTKYGKNLITIEGIYMNFSILESDSKALCTYINWNTETLRGEIILE